MLAEPTRRRILDHLRTSTSANEPGSDVTTLVTALSLTQPHVSKHLRVLRDAGAVTVRVDGQRRVYRLAEQPLSEVAHWLEPYRRMWRDHLDALERLLDQDLTATTTADTAKEQETP